MKAFVQRRYGAAALGAATVGALAGLVVALLAAPSYDAGLTLLVAHGAQLPKSSEEARQAARTVSALAEGDSVARGVGDSFGAAPADVEAHPIGASGLVALSVRGSSSAGAVRAAQQAGLTVSQLVSTRLSATGLSATIWDPPRRARKVRPGAKRDVAAGALTGLVAAIGVLLARRRRSRPPLPVPELESEPEPVPEPEPMPEPMPEQERDPEPAPPALEPRPGRFNVDALERLVDSAPVEPARADEWRAYLAALGGQVDEDGLLPASLDSVVHEVFGVLFVEHPQASAGRSRTG
jgi:hypothetical protein